MPKTRDIQRDPSPMIALSERICYRANHQPYKWWKTCPPLDGGPTHTALAAWLPGLGHIAQSTPSTVGIEGTRANLVGESEQTPDTKSMFPREQRCWKRVHPKVLSGDGWKGCRQQKENCTNPHFDGVKRTVCEVWHWTWPVPYGYPSRA